MLEKAFLIITWLYLLKNIIEILPFFSPKKELKVIVNKGDCIFSGLL